MKQIIDEYVLDTDNIRSVKRHILVYILRFPDSSKELNLPEAISVEVYDPRHVNYKLGISLKKYPPLCVDFSEDLDKEIKDLKNLKDIYPKNIVDTVQDRVHAVVTYKSNLLVHLQPEIITHLKERYNAHLISRCFVPKNYVAQTKEKSSLGLEDFS